MPTHGFTFSDTIAGYVHKPIRAERSFGLETSDGQQYRVHLASNAYARITQNLGESYIDCTSRMAELLDEGQFVYVYGIFYPEGDAGYFEAKSLVFPGDNPDRYRHEEPDWWVNQLNAIASSYMRWQFNHPQWDIDFKNYRTILHLAGAKKGDFLQETDTISRLVYGMASAYMLRVMISFLKRPRRERSIYGIICVFTTRMRIDLLVSWNTDVGGNGSRNYSPRSSVMTTIRFRCMNRYMHWLAPFRPIV